MQVRILSPGQYTLGNRSTAGLLVLSQPMRVQILLPHRKNIMTRFDEVCDQRGTHPHELRPEHSSDGGIGELTLEQYDPSQIVQFPMCLNCAREEFNADAPIVNRRKELVTLGNKQYWILIQDSGPDDRFRWIRRPYAGLPR